MNPITKFAQEKNPTPTSPAMKNEAELTPKAEAKAANKLPKAEQLNKFEKDLEEHDSGNRPA